MGVFSLVATGSVCALMMFFIVKKPVIVLPFIKKNVQSFWVIALLAPLLLFLGGAVTLKEFFISASKNNAMNPLKISVLFMCMCFLSAALDEAGFFEYCALRILKNSGKSQMRLFVLFYLTISVLTVFTSNDIIILAFTPFICYFCKNAKIDALPYVLALFTAANSWSVMLIIGNPTNIYIASSFNITFFEYLKIMFLPAVTAGVIPFAALTAVYYKKLKAPVTAPPLNVSVKLKDKAAAAVSLFFLSACIITLAAENLLNISMWLASLVFAGLLFIALIVLNFIRKRKSNSLDNPARIGNILKTLPYCVLPFLLSMFTAVLALNKHGITQDLSQFMFGLSAGKGGKIAVFGAGAALFSNLINNIPMSILFTSVLQNHSGAGLMSAVMAAVIGSNIGAFISPTGALAGVMFLGILKKNGLNLSAAKFIAVLAPIAVITLLGALAVLSVTVPL